MKTLQEIREVCEKYNITNYIINDDCSIDVDGDVNLENMKLSKLPLKFRNVSYNFFCCYNQLTSLEGAPQSVGWGFYCSYNQLASLEGAPQSVGGGFYCRDNQLTSLDGAPQSVGGGFYCSYNQLASLEGAPQSVGGGFYCDNYLFEEMIDKTKPLLKSRKSWRDKIIKNYKKIFCSEFEEYFKLIKREEKLKQLGI